MNILVGMTQGGGGGSCRVTEGERGNGKARGTLSDGKKKGGQSILIGCVDVYHRRIVCVFLI